jgi:hypothetical protein
MGESSPQQIALDARTVNGNRYGLDKNINSHVIQTGLDCCC